KMFRIKICGVTHRLDVRVAIALGADAIGLNLFEDSPRYVPPRFVDAVAGAVPAGVVKVGVFVNAPAADVCRTFDRLRLDLVQLSGDETPEYVAELAGLPTMKAFRFGPDGLGPAEK